MSRPRCALARGLASCLSALLLTMASRAAASAGIFVEPELGYRSFTGDLARLFDPGVSCGGAVGIDATPQLRLFAELEFSFHPSARDTAYGQIDQGLAVGTTFGGRFIPFGKSASRSVQPYISAESGFTFLNWRLKDDYIEALGKYADNRDGIAMLTMGAEAGVMLRTGSMWRLSLAARVRHHVSTDMPPNGFNAQAPQLTPGAGRDFKGGEFGAIARVGFWIGE